MIRPWDYDKFLITLLRSRRELIKHYFIWSFENAIILPEGFTWGLTTGVCGAEKNRNKFIVDNSASVQDPKCYFCICTLVLCEQKTTAEPCEFEDDDPIIVKINMLFQIKHKGNY